MVFLNREMEDAEALRGCAPDLRHHDRAGELGAEVRGGLDRAHRDVHRDATIELGPRDVREETDVLGPPFCGRRRRASRRAPGT